MNNSQVAWCPNCSEYKNYSIDTSTVFATIKGCTVSYREFVGFCKCCGQMISVPSIEESNKGVRELAYNDEIKRLKNTKKF